MGGVWRTVKRMKQTCVGALRSKQGSCSSGGVWRTAKRRKQTCVGALRSKRGSCSSGGVWRIAKRDSTGYCSSPPSTSSSLHGLPSTSSSLHGLLFIQPPPRATPPATVQPALSTGSCSTTPPRATVHPALHRLLFILPSTGWSCSSSPPRGPVHPAPTGSINRGPIHPEATTGSCSSTPPGNCSSKPPSNTHYSSNPSPPPQHSQFIQRQHRSASVSSSSEGIARSGSVNSHRSVARVL